MPEVLTSARPSCIWVILTVNKFIPLLTLARCGYWRSGVLLISGFRGLIGALCA